jgi:hypothetical protein
MLLPHGRPKINVLEYSKKGLLVKNSFSEMTKYKMLSKNGGDKKWWCVQQSPIINCSTYALAAWAPQD